MKYFISDLIVGMKHFAEFADWIESNEDPDLCIEFTAFTHDEAYWQALAAKVPQMTCPLPFHGPYVNIEATSDIGSEGNVWLMESYKMMAKQTSIWTITMERQIFGRSCIGQGNIPRMQTSLSSMNRMKS